MSQRCHLVDDVDGDGLAGALDIEHLSWPKRRAVHTHHASERGGHVGSLKRAARRRDHETGVVARIWIIRTPGVHDIDAHRASHGVGGLDHRPHLGEDIPLRPAVGEGLDN